MKSIKCFKYKDTFKFEEFLSVLIFNFISKSRALFLILVLICVSINFLIAFSTRFGPKSCPKKICLLPLSHQSSHQLILVSGFVKKLSVKVNPKSSFVQICLIVRLIIISHLLNLFYVKIIAYFVKCDYANKQNMLSFAF